jgi:hypothetical protein
MKQRESVSVRLDGKPFRPPWVKPGETWAPLVDTWKEPEWWKERMREHPLHKYATRIELEYFARTGKIMRASTLAKRLAASRQGG